MYSLRYCILPKTDRSGSSWNTPRWVVEARERNKTGGGSSSGGTFYACRFGYALDLKFLEQDLCTMRMSQYTKCGQGRQALAIYEEMRKCELPLTTYTFIAALKACSSLRDLESAKQIHAELVKCGLDSILVVGNVLVDVYAKCGSLVDARCVFESIPRRNVVSWNTMILGYAQLEKGEVALQMFTRMQQEGVVPNDRSFVSVLKACSSLAPSRGGNIAGDIRLKRRCLDQVRAIHLQATKSGIELDVFVGTALVGLYAKCGSVVEARHVFEKMPQRNVVSWTAIILAYAQVEEGEVALQLYARMQLQGVVADAQAYVAALKACSSLASSGEGNKGDGILVKKHCLEQVRDIHSDVVKGQFKSDMFVGTMLVDVYVKCGSLVDAKHVFERMPCRDVVAWTAMILGYAQIGDCDVALQLYAEMQQEGVVPNGRTFAGALKACGSVAGLQKGKEIHAQICRTGAEAHNPFLASSLIDMYSKCASMNEAQQVFDASPTRNIVMWSALMAGYARLGESELVFHLFDMMRQGGVQPEEVTFLTVLTACSHAGLVDKGQKYFEVMSRDFGITPTIKHYTCMVDLLGRAGKLDEAFAMVQTMPLQPNGVLWKSVLGACRKWGNLDLGRHAFECAVVLDKTDGASYILMQNIYAAAHMLKDRKEIQAMRMKAQAWKKPGQSWWTDTGGVVHAFLVGDREHPDSQDIYAKMDDLLPEMKKQGYVPHLDSVLQDIPDDEKEDALCGHSEKLAIAYALLRTPAGTTIRVVKNLRVCEDCHAAIALISKIEQRTIICRDANRFHVYNNGTCSCRNYW